MRSTVVLVALLGGSAGLMGCGGGGTAPTGHADASSADGAHADAAGGGDVQNDVARPDAAKDATAAPDAPSNDAGHDATSNLDAGLGGDVHSTSDAAADALDESVPADSSVTDGGLADGCALGPSGEPTDLRCTGLYADWSAKTVSSTAHEYVPGIVLWSDGAKKTRWIQLPAGAAIDTSNMDEWTFPVGTKVWKEFVVGGKRIETRLLWKMAVGNWYLTTYRWADDLSSAPELTAGELNVNGSTYEVPTQQECFQCHNGRLDQVLGFEAVALSAPSALVAVTATTPAAVTLAQLKTAGWLTEAPSAPLTVPGSAPTAAALGYLHMNCGTSCHNDNGAAFGTGFFMRLDVGTLASVASTNTVTTGVGKLSEFDIPDAAQSYRFEPHSLAESAAYYRMHIRDSNQIVQMPPIDTHVVDDAGVGTVGAWILAGCGN